MKQLRAFSLIELIVVVSIIALLIAILLPMLARTREDARRIQCASNLHQIGLATTAAAIDQDGFFPVREKGLSTSPQIAFKAGGAGDNRGMWVGYLEGYTIETSSPAFYCPSFEGGIHTLKEGWPHSRNGSTWYVWGYTYFAAYHFDNRWASSIDIPLSIEDPVNAPIWGDMMETKTENTWMHSAHNEGGSAGGQDLGGVIPPEGGNFVYIDGSVSWTQFVTGESPFNQPEYEAAISYRAGHGYLWPMKGP